MTTEAGTAVGCDLFVVPLGSFPFPRELRNLKAEAPKAQPLFRVVLEGGFSVCPTMDPVPSPISHPWLFQVLRTLTSGTGQRSYHHSPSCQVVETEALLELPGLWH